MTINPSAELPVPTNHPETGRKRFPKKPMIHPRDQKGSAVFLNLQNEKNLKHQKKMSQKNRKFLTKTS